jgi:hypothetical protein
LSYISLNPAGGAILLTNYIFRSDGSLYFDCSQNATCILRDGQDTYTLTAFSNGQTSVTNELYGIRRPTENTTSANFLVARLSSAKISAEEYKTNPIGFWWFRIN